MRVFLTGGSGFVGSHTARALVAARLEVRALHRGAAPSAQAGVEWVEGDVLEPASLARGMAGCDAAIHVAAVLAVGNRTAAHQHAVNVEGTRNVVDAAIAAGIKRFVFTSSIAAVGRPAPGEIADENQRYDWPPGFPYNESKRDSERIALAAGGRGLDVVVLNPAWVFGPEAPRAHFRNLLRAIKFGLAVVAPPGGATICDVRDVADAHVAALTRGRIGERYVLGGPRITHRELFTLLARSLDAPGPLLALPAWSVRVAALPFIALEGHVGLPISPRLLPEYARDRFYSSEKAIAELGYRERPADEIIDDMVEWYRRAGAI